LLVWRRLRLEMGPDPTQAYFWPAVNKRPTCLWPGYYWPYPKRFFLTRREKIEKFDIFRGNFPNSNPNHKWLARPGSKIFDLDPSLIETTTIRSEQKKTFIEIQWYLFRYCYFLSSFNLSLPVMGPGQKFWPGSSWVSHL